MQLYCEMQQKWSELVDGLSRDAATSSRLIRMLDSFIDGIARIAERKSVFRQPKMLEIRIETPVQQRQYKRRVGDKNERHSNFGGCGG